MSEDARVRDLEIENARLHKNIDVLLENLEKAETALRADSRHWRWGWHRTAKDLRAALEALVTKIGQVHADPAYTGVWVLYQVHGGRYTGPSYGPELDAAVAALRATDGVSHGTIPVESTT